MASKLAPGQEAVARVAVGPNHADPAAVAAQFVTQALGVQRGIQAAGTLSGLRAFATPEVCPVFCKAMPARPTGNLEDWQRVVQEAEALALASSGIDGGKVTWVNVSATNRTGSPMPLRLQQANGLVLARWGKPQPSTWLRWGTLQSLRDGIAESDNAEVIRLAGLLPPVAALRALEGIWTAGGDLILAQGQASVEVLQALAAGAKSAAGAVASIGKNAGTLLALAAGIAGLWFLRPLFGGKK